MLPETVTLERVKHRPTHAAIDSLQLPENMVVGFLKGELRAGEVAKAWRAQVRRALGLLGRIKITVRVPNPNPNPRNPSFLELDLDVLISFPHLSRAELVRE